MNAEELLDMTREALLSAPPPGVDVRYAGGFFRRNRERLLSLLREALRGAPIGRRRMRLAQRESGLRIRFADMVEAMKVEGLPAQPEAHTLTAALEAALADYGVRASVGSELSRDGSRFYRATVNREEDAPVLTAFWENTIPLNGVWQGTGALNPAVEVAGYIARHLLRLHRLTPEEAPDAEGWGDLFSAVQLEKALVANAALPTVVLRSPVAKGLVWRVQNAHLSSLKGLVPSAEVHFRVAEDDSLADIRDTEIPGGLDGRHSLIVYGAPHRTVSLVHPMDLPGDALQQWQQIFDDYNILQPFPQLHRTMDLCHPDERADWLTTRVGQRVREPAPGSITLRFRSLLLRIAIRVVDGRVAEVGIADVKGGRGYGAGVLAELSVRDWSEVVRAVEGVVE